MAIITVPNTQDHYRAKSLNCDGFLDLDSCLEPTIQHWDLLHLNPSALAWLTRYHLIPSVRQTAASYLHTLNSKAGKKKPKVLRPCTKCGQEFGYRDMRVHKRSCTYKYRTGYRHGED